MTETKVPTESDLKELGFSTAATKLSEDRELARKMRIAFEHFRVVSPDKIHRFNEELLARTKKNTKYGGYTYQCLAFTPVAQYPNIPPTDVLDKMREAKALGCFDDFEIATIQSREVIPDPVVFGVIKGCVEKYYVAQWDNDVRIEDILRPEEG